MYAISRECVGVSHVPDYDYCQCMGASCALAKLLSFGRIPAAAVQPTVVCCGQFREKEQSRLSLRPCLAPRANQPGLAGLSLCGLFLSKHRSQRIVGECVPGVTRGVCPELQAYSDTVYVLYYFQTRKDDQFQGLPPRQFSVS